MGLSVKERTRLIKAREEWLHRFLLTMPADLWLDYKFLYKNYGKELVAREESGQLIDPIGLDGFRKWLPTSSVAESELFQIEGGHPQRKYKLRQDASCNDCLSSLGKRAAKLILRWRKRVNVSR